MCSRTHLFRNRDDIFLIGDIDIGYPVQLDFKLSTTGKKSKWRFNTARVSVPGSTDHSLRIPIT